MLYPSVTLAGARTYADDRELQLACVRAYNEWLVEFCAGRRRTARSARPSSRRPASTTRSPSSAGVSITACAAPSSRRIPNGTLRRSRARRTIRSGTWRRRRGTPLGVHIGSFTESGLAPGKIEQSTVQFMAGAGASKAGAQTIPVVAQLVFSGVPQRFPRLSSCSSRPTSAGSRPCWSSSTTCSSATAGSAARSSG